MSAEEVGDDNPENVTVIDDAAHVVVVLPTTVELKTGEEDDDCIAK